MESASIEIAKHTLLSAGFILAVGIITGFIASTGSFYWAFATAAAFILIGVLSYLLLLGRIDPIPEPS